MNKKIILIDGNSIINRAFYGIPTLTDGKGRHTNAVYGFVNMMFRLIDEEEPTHMAVTFDMKAKTFRHALYPEYKGTRNPMPDELFQQMGLLKQMLSVMHIKIYEKEGYEADDILGTLSVLSEQAGFEVVIVSGDRDLLQFASDTLKIRLPKSKFGKAETEVYYADDIKVKYGLEPKQLIDMKALMGDASDNIKGVTGIGEKTALKLIQEYGSLEEAIEHAHEISPRRVSANLILYQENARMSRKLVEIVTDLDIPFDSEELSIEQMCNEKSYELMKELQFKSMYNRFYKSGIGSNKKVSKVFQNRHNDMQMTLYSEMTQNEEKVALIKDINFQTTPHYYSNSKEETEKLLSKIQRKPIYYLFLESENQFLGMSLFQENVGAMWIESNVFEGFTERDLLRMVLPLFKKKYRKISHDIKKDIKIFRQYADIHLYEEDFEYGFDAKLASYILNPTGNSYEYDDIARDYLNIIVPSWEEIIGKGRTKRSFFLIPQNERFEFVIKQPEILYHAFPIMENLLEENGQTQLFYEIEMPLIFVLSEMEKNGIRLDKEALSQYGLDLDVKIGQIIEEIFEISEEEFNLNSPKQLGMILFEKLKLPHAKKTKTGYSTSAEVLEKLRFDYPIVEKILKYRQLSKLKSTYVNSLLSVSHDVTEKIYSTFNQTSTATGRISSIEPNLQNIPTKTALGREIRKAFIPTNEDFCFLDADYSQIELRVLADIAKDETLIQAFNEDQDIHQLTASQVFHVPFEEVTSQQRSEAKAVNFGIVYGMGAFSLGQDLKITKAEAEAYIEAYFTKYPRIKTYLEEVVDQARLNGYVETLWHRRRDMPELKSTTFLQKAFGERVAMNMPIQGTAADIMKIAMIKVYRALKDGNYQSRLILQVHDELLIETHKNEVEKVEEILRKHMEEAVQLSVKLKVDIHRGESWYDAK